MSLGDFLADSGWCFRHPSLDALVDRYRFWGGRIDTPRRH